MFFELFYMTACLLICRLVYLYFYLGKKKNTVKQKTIKLMAVAGSGKLKLGKKWLLKSFMVMYGLKL